MGFAIRLIIMSSIFPLVLFSALFFCGFISLGLYLLFFFSTVSISCCYLVFNLLHKQRPISTNTEVTPSSSSSSSSSSSPSGKFRYDVFLSFRGTDTRNNFTDHLYNALKQKGIFTFRDDEELQRGESIGPNLLKAIEESRYVIVVFSPNYADSAWCLDEIAKVSDCMNEMGQKVLPVFYHVDPSDVRRQIGEHFGKAFQKHQRRYKGDPGKVKRWKDALFQVGNLSGWHLQHGSESEVIHNIVEKVFSELNKLISTSEGLVGMDSHLNELFSYLDIGCLDVRIIGICGMGGIGKTTIAQVVFDRLKAQFEGHSFLENVKQETESKQGSTIHLQERLLLNFLHGNVNVQNTKMGIDTIRHRLSTKRVLVVLDDVDHDKQLETLCHRTWFGPGSRIIITSRDENLIKAFGADKVYKVNPLTDSEALELFCLKAFNEDKVEEDFLKLSKEFLKHANGLPIAIKVLGSSVRGRSVNLWSSALKRLKKNPQKGIIDVLKVSFDGLEETEKKTFLDIACFFKGENKDRVIRILNGCDDDGVEMDVQVLMDKSLVTLFGAKLWMHDLIQEMGWDVVLQECREEPGKRSRLWVSIDIIDVLGRSKATSAVQSIFLQCPSEDNVVHSIGNAFTMMDRLRLLKISNVKLSGNIRYLSNELQYLEWDDCPLDSFPSDFQPEKLVEVRLHFSRIKQLWSGKRGWSMLRHLDLSDSKYLISTPDFTVVPNLEKLVLQCCTSLVKIHPSIGFLKKLISLNMRKCKSIKSIPHFITTLESLQKLRLSLCSGLKKFPDIEGNMESLLKLHLDRTSIEELPSSIGRLTGLIMLNLRECKNLLHLPNTIVCLTSLKSLHLTGCSKINEIPGNLNGLKCLENLSIGGTSIRELSFIVGMKNLRYLSCRGCKGLIQESFKGLAALSKLIELDLSYCNLMDGEFLNDFNSPISLTELNLRGNCFVRLPYSICQLSKLETLDLSNCRQLQVLPKKLPLSLGCIWAQDCTSLLDYPNQIKILHSLESGITIVNSLSSSAHEISQSSERSALSTNVGGSIGDVVMRVYATNGKQVDLLSLTTIPHLEQMPLGLSFSTVLPTDEIPEWFSLTSTRNPISMSIPQNLADDNKWKGFAVCAIFSVKGFTAFSLIKPDTNSCNYSYQITLETDVVCLERAELKSDSCGSISHLLVIFYISHSKVSQWGLNQSTVVKAMFETTNPFMVVQKCGIRLVYEQDAGWDSKLFRRPDMIWLNKDEYAASVLEASWLSRSLKWEKFIQPLTEESTLVPRKNLMSVLPRYLEAQKYYSAPYIFNLVGSPGWFRRSFAFGRKSNKGIVSIKLPQNLHKSKKWMGFAIYISHVEEVEVEKTLKQDFKRVSVILRTGDKLAKVMDRALVHIGPLFKGHELWVIYIPRVMIPETLLTQTLTTDMDIYMKVSSSPHVEIQRCGFRIVYQEDIQGFSETIIRCMQRDDSLEYYNKLLVEEWMQLIRLKGAQTKRMTERYSRTAREQYLELHSRKYRNWDWSDPCCVHCVFKRNDIFTLKWFTPCINQGNSAEIQLPQNVFDDDNWLGFTLCFSLSRDKYPNISLGSTVSVDSEDVRLMCRLDSDVDQRGLVDYMMQADMNVLEPLDYNTTVFHYIPRTEVISKVWRQCKLARITIWSNTYIAVHSCALRLLFKEDVEHLVETLTFAELP